ncbi:DcaP family trimeric outer membrane transporter [Telmatospirillum sp.]|uniref:DcaP family trimeric outer membrane transporter n=1 Tax=Telmatospirillum sp. TaxID=2079197 RepID=UPI00284A81CE|nr:DcaP family trimeric outer membrane transporter [Telmatospirillum sp.]MDR3440501.1 DcaP family trimeric outer membrane transporter [Telmatospirillum sp.]
MLRLRHATGEWRGLLIGMTESNFEDHEAGVESVEFNNSIGRANGIRQSMVQYQHLLGPGRLSVALESPTGDFKGSDQPALNTGMNTISTNVQDKVPDFTAAYMYKDSWGHVQVMGVARDLSVDTGGAASANSTVTGGAKIQGEGSAFAGGGGISALIFTNKVDGKDNYITAQFEGGDGIGRYIQGIDTGSQAGYFNNATRVLHTEAAYGFTVAYRNWWSSTWRTNIIYGHTHASNFSAMDTADVTTNPNRSLDNVYVNLIWNPAPQIQMGLEYVLGHRIADGPTSTAVSKVSATTAPGATSVKNEAWGNRIQFATQYNF